jgi:hypothetical protein
VTSGHPHDGQQYDSEPSETLPGRTMRWNRMSNARRLHVPGYSWADTPESWRVPGLTSTDSNAHRLSHRPLTDAVERLRGLEAGRGTWILAPAVVFNRGLLGRGFPVIASFMGADNHPAVSTLSPHIVSEVLAPAFAEARSAGGHAI